MRRAFTLMELLIVMLIMSILAALALSALAGATEQAREARTRSIVAKLDQLIAEKLESYLTRPVRVPSTYDPDPNDPTRRIITDPRTQALIRLNALRDTMRTELPDRKTDVVNRVVVGGIEYSPADCDPRGGRIYRLPINAAQKAYTRKAMRATNSPNAALANWSEVSQGAECLYLIVASMRDGDRNALDFFQPSEIGDLDGDGMKEILDAWGRPIEFLRWAPGFLPEDGAVTMQNSDASLAPDTFDVLKADPRWASASPPYPIALYPLIFSGGRNKTLDIFTDNTMGFHSYANGGDNSAPDPYAQFASGFYAGQPMDSDGDGELTYGDNITNHSLER